MISQRTLLAALKVKLHNETASRIRERYNNKPVLWTEERAKGEVWSIPRKIMESVVTHRHTAVPACHQIGKSWLAARIAVWWIDSHPPGSAFVVTTAPSSKQVKAVLWKEIRRTWNIANLNGRLNQTEWWLNDELIAMGRKPSDYDPTAFQGIHAKHCLVILDEGCGIPEQIYLAAESLAANEFSRILVIGNPDDPDSYFCKVCQPGSGWNVIPVSAYDTPNFTGEEVSQDVKDVLISSIYVDYMKIAVGEDSPVFLSKVLGQFPTNKTDGVIPLSFIRNCQDEDEYENASGDDRYPVEVGIDVGAGGDETSLRVRFGKFVGPFVERKTPTALEAFDLVVPFLMEHKPSRIKIDIIGVGWGLLGLIQQAVIRSTIAKLSTGKTGYSDERTGEWIDLSFLNPHMDTVLPVNVGMRSTDPERFPRLRDQMWWEIGRLLSQDCGWNLYGLDEETVGQLVSPTWQIDTSNRHKIESKQETIKRTKRASPNKADALLLAFCNPPMPDEESLLVIHEPVTIGPDL